MIVREEYIQDVIHEMDDPQAENRIEEGESIEEAFKNLRWTRVIALKEFEEAATHVFKMADDIIYGQQQMAGVKLDGLPQLCTHFDPIKW
jgi:hypothetical protein